MGSTVGFSFSHSCPSVTLAPVLDLIIGIMEKKMETTIVLYWGCIGIMEKKMETIIVYWSPWNREEFLTGHTFCCTDASRDTVGFDELHDQCTCK